MEVKSWNRRSCAVCGQLKFPTALASHCFTDDKLDLLRDDTVPLHLRPQTYDFLLYHRALLHQPALSSTTVRTHVSVCATCRSSLKRKEKPVDALANKLYYGLDRIPEEVRAAFRTATALEKMYIAACRLTRITYIMHFLFGRAI